MARTPEEKVMDRLLTLYIINRCRERHHVRYLSETKMQKLIFLSEKDLIDRRYKALNYRFIRLLHPTYSTELKNDLANLVQLGYLDEPTGFGRTRKMIMLMEDFGHLFSRNHEITDAINEVLNTFANIPTNRLLQMVFKMPWGRGTIEDLRMRKLMLYPLRREKAYRVFDMSEDDFENLMICLSPRVSGELDQAFDEMRRGELLSHEEVFGEL